MFCSFLVESLSIIIFKFYLIILASLSNFRISTVFLNAIGIYIGIECIGLFQGKLELYNIPFLKYNRSNTYLDLVYHLVKTVVFIQRLFISVVVLCSQSWQYRHDSLRPTYKLFQAANV